jgi:23S rRNA (pseudouridine1915-N3)-methyltransferase
MKIRFLWPGKTRDSSLRRLVEFHAERIGGLVPCEIVETSEARGVAERFRGKILDIEARGLEKHFKDDYIVCLSGDGKEMSSEELAAWLGQRAALSARTITFVVGGFLGLHPRVLERANLRLSLSRLTFSHELSRVVVTEQIYRAISIMKGRQYAK